MTDQLHRLIDGGAIQQVINERVAALLESQRNELLRIGGDHEKRIRFIERTINYALGAMGLISTLLYLISVFKK
jgi:low affinity Fe/Cu permease